MSDRRGGCLTALLLVLSVSLVVVGGGLLYLVATGRMPSPDRSEVVPASNDQVLRPGEFADYDWEELAYVARLIAEAPSDEEGVNVAREWGVEVGDVRPLSLTDGRQASMTVVGIRCDERSDGTGRAGLTLMVSPIAIRPMSESGSNDGGWEASSLRAWLQDDGLALLPDELAEEVVSVRKATNNVGIASDSSCVTATDDRLWLFSLTEIAGEIDLFANEYGDEVRERTYYIDYGVYTRSSLPRGSSTPTSAWPASRAHLIPMASWRSSTAAPPRPGGTGVPIRSPLRASRAPISIRSWIPATHPHSAQWDRAPASR